jgi:hypothetical protein
VDKDPRTRRAFPDVDTRHNIYTSSGEVIGDGKEASVSATPLKMKRSARTTVTEGRRPSRYSDGRRILEGVHGTCLIHIS